MKQSKSTTFFGGKKPGSTAGVVSASDSHAFNVSFAMHNSSSDYNFIGQGVQKQQHYDPNNGFNRLSCSESSAYHYHLGSDNSAQNISMSRSCSGSTANSSQMSSLSGFDYTKNLTHPSSTASVHHTRNFNSPSRNSIQSYGGSSVSSSFEKIDDFAPSGHNFRINVNEMIKSGVKDEEILSIWLHNLRFEEYIPLFLNAGYDLATISKMTPEDLTAIGITKPGHRKRLTAEIRKLIVCDNWPSSAPVTIRDWLSAINMPQYVSWFAAQGYVTMEQIMNLTWEDFEDIGVKKLGHLKKMVCALKKMKDCQRRSRGAGGTLAKTKTNGSYTMDFSALSTAKSEMTRVSIIHPAIRRNSEGNLSFRSRSGPLNDNSTTYRASFYSPMPTFNRGLSEDAIKETDLCNDIDEDSLGDNLLREEYCASRSRRSSETYDSEKSRNDCTVSSTCNDIFWNCPGFHYRCRPTSNATHLVTNDTLLYDDKKLLRNENGSVKNTNENIVLHQPDRPKLAVKPCSIVTQNQVGNIDNKPCFETKKVPISSPYTPTISNGNIASKQSSSSSSSLVSARPTFAHAQLLSIYENGSRGPTIKSVPHSQMYPPPPAPPPTQQQQQLFNSDAISCPSDVGSSPEDTISPVQYSPPFLNPVSCEEQIRNLYLVRSGGGASFAGQKLTLRDSGGPAYNGNLAPEKHHLPQPNSPVPPPPSHHFSVKRVTFANCPQQIHHHREKDPRFNEFTSQDYLAYRTSSNSNHTLRASDNFLTSAVNTTVNTEGRISHLNEHRLAASQRLIVDLFNPDSPSIA